MGERYLKLRTVVIVARTFEIVIGNHFVLPQQWIGITVPLLWIVGAHPSHRQFHIRLPGAQEHLSRIALP